MSDPDKLKHLDYLQQTITRMATVSFQIKTWNIGLVTAVLAFAAGDKNPNFLWAALLPAVMLWFLDSFFLRQERLYRCLYNDVRKANSTVEAFSMDTRDYLKDPNPDVQHRLKRWNVFISETDFSWRNSGSSAAGDVVTVAFDKSTAQLRKNNAQ